MRKLFYLFIILGMTGCDLFYPSIMLKTPKNFAYTPLTDSTSSTLYKIAPNDFVNMRLFSNDGFKLIDFTNIVDNGGNSMFYVNNGIEYLVENDGTVMLPVIGKTKMSGLNVRQAIEMLQEKYSQYYIKPYILLRITNRRVIVFPGNPGTAKVIPLINDNTTLIEALALCGGITEDGKAKQIKLIRGDPNKPEVYLIDLSTINGIKAGNTILQANDLIYVTPQRRPAVQALERLTPTLGLITSLLTVFLLIKTTKL
jgi:polysaccharide export outer membrane protein